MLLVTEFSPTKVPWLDSAWDAARLHPRAGRRLLAAGVFGADNATMAVVAGWAARSRPRRWPQDDGRAAAVNTSPGAVFQLGLSFLEDGLVVAVVWLATQHPVWFGVALV